MCCFSTHATVYNTRIFARLTAPDTQVTAYQMRYESTEPTAMILPLPVALPSQEDRVQWKNLREYGAFFDDLAAGFPSKPGFSLPFARSKSAGAEAAAPLAVHEVGDFVASFVPTVDDFARLDPRFVIKKEVWAKIPAYKDYGFAVFQLKSLSGTPHPIAFEWKTRLRDTLFFPTVHIHDGTVHNEDDFDHALYLQGAAFDRRAGGYDGPESPDRATGLTRSLDHAASFAKVEKSAGLLQGDLLVHRMQVFGKHPNIDLLVKLLPAPTGTGCGRCDLAPFPPAGRPGLGAAALAALAFVIRRRDALRSRP